MKKLTTLLLLTLLPLMASAYDAQVDGIYYNLNTSTKEAELASCGIKYTGSVTIPESFTYDGVRYSVTTIGYKAFTGCSDLTSVTIPSSVTSIGEEAFNGCSGLTSVTIPSSVTSIGEEAFNGCSGLTSVTIPNSVTNIGISAFFYCDGLKEVTIGNSVTTIGSNAFSYCSDLTSVTIPSSVTSIGEKAFYECSSLTEVTINSDAIVSKGYQENSPISSIFGSQVKEYIIGEGVTSIGHRIFTGCSNLTSVTIPSSVTSIGNWAFGNCSGLTSVTIPNRVTSIGSCAFYQCYSLTEMTIPDNVISIKSYAFTGCSGLTSVTIPSSVTTIGEEAFLSCSNLTSVTINSDAIVSKEYQENSPISSIFGSQVKEYIIGEGVTSIGHRIFTGCSNLTSVTIPSSVTLIGNRAFYGCSGLTSVTIPNSVTNIGISAFFHCDGLKKVTIGNSVTAIGNYAFYECLSLTSVTIPSSVTSIGEEAFLYCSNLTLITCKATSVPSTGNNAFDYIPLSSATLYVPEASVAAYKATAPWSDFGTIKPMGDEESIYIETDVTANFPTDWQGWNGATGYTATQFAPMVTTNDGRRVQVCEKFNDSSAATGTVFFRTLTGLTNGTYRIELYGAASSTKGRDTNISSDMTADDEGDETAVYLYAKTPSGTVKQYIPVHWATSFSEVATAVLNGVEVTDGTIEIGMYSEKKFTNWHVVQIKGVTALVDAEEMHTNALQTAQASLADGAYTNVVGEERTALAQTIRQYSTVTEQTSGAYQTAINALVAATSAFTNAKVSYDEWAHFKNLSFPYASAEKKTAAETAAAANPTNAADAVSKAESLATLFRSYAESSALLEGVDGATDMTSYIKNPKAESAIVSSEWQTVFGNDSGGSINIQNNQPWTDASGNTTHKYFDGGDWESSAWDVTLQQEITLPAGKYQLTAIGRSASDVELTLFAGNNIVEMPHIGSVGGLFNLGWEQTSVEFELADESTVKIGVRGVTNVIHNWMSFSDFRLVKFPETIIETGIAINETNFPDENFRNWILSQDYGSDGVLTDAEIAGITSIDVRSLNIKNLQGIEFFTALTEFSCYGNQLTSLDISKNTALTELSCGNNQLTSLDVSKNTALKELQCHYNQLTSIDVSKNTALTKLYCYGNKLTSLDVSQNTALKTLHYYQNQIKGEAMDALIASLPTVSDGTMRVIYNENEQNVMTTTQVAAANAKGWTPYYYYGGWWEYTGSEPEPEPAKKCATPTIRITEGKLHFSCETEGVTYVSHVEMPASFDGDSDDIILPKVKVTVYAHKDGYEDSDIAMKEIIIGSASGIRGDLNGDGTVSMPDAMFIVNKILNGKFPDE